MSHTQCLHGRFQELPRCCIFSAHVLKPLEIRSLCTSKGTLLLSDYPFGVTCAQLQILGFCTTKVCNTRLSAEVVELLLANEAIQREYGNRHCGTTVKLTSTVVGYHSSERIRNRLQSVSMTAFRHLHAVEAILNPSKIVRNCDHRGTQVIDLRVQK